MPILATIAILSAMLVAAADYARPTLAQAQPETAFMEDFEWLGEADSKTRFAGSNWSQSAKFMGLVSSRDSNLYDWLVEQSSNSTAYGLSNSSSGSMSLAIMPSTKSASSQAILSIDVPPGTELVRISYTAFALLSSLITLGLDLNLDLGEIDLELAWRWQGDDEWTTVGTATQLPFASTQPYTSNTSVIDVSDRSGEKLQFRWLVPSHRPLEIGFAIDNVAVHILRSRPFTYEQSFAHFSASGISSRPSVGQLDGRYWSSPSAMLGMLPNDKTDVRNINDGVYGAETESSGRSLVLKASPTDETSVVLTVPPKPRHSHLFVRYFAERLRARAARETDAFIDLSWRPEGESLWREVPEGSIVFDHRGGVIGADIQADFSLDGYESATIQIRWRLRNGHHSLVSIDDLAISTARPEVVVFIETVPRELPTSKVLTEALIRELQRWGRQVVTCEEDAVGLKEKISALLEEGNAPTGSRKNAREDIISKLLESGCVAPRISRFSSARLTANEDPRTGRRELILRIRNIEEPSLPVKIETAVEPDSSRWSWSQLVERAVERIVSASPPPIVELPLRSEVREGGLVVPGRNAIWQGASRMRRERRVYECHSELGCEQFRDVLRRYFQCQRALSGNSAVSGIVPERCVHPRASDWSAFRLKLEDRALLPTTLVARRGVGLVVSIEAQDINDRRHGDAEYIQTIAHVHDVDLSVGAGILRPQNEELGPVATGQIGYRYALIRRPVTSLGLGAIGDVSGGKDRIWGSAGPSAFADLAKPHVRFVPSLSTNLLFGLERPLSAGAQLSTRFIFRTPKAISPMVDISVRIPFKNDPAISFWLSAGANLWR